MRDVKPADLDITLGVTKDGVVFLAHPEINYLEPKVHILNMTGPINKLSQRNFVSNISGSCACAIRLPSA